MAMGFSTFLKLFVFATLLLISSARGRKCKGKKIDQLVKSHATCLKGGMIAIRPIRLMVYLISLYYVWYARGKFVDKLNTVSGLVILIYFDT